MREQDIFKGIKACIFDLDGTLVDSMKVWAKVDRQFFLSKGMTIPEDYQKAIAHMTLMENARYTVERFGFSETPDQYLCPQWNYGSRKKGCGRGDLSGGGQGSLYY